MSVDHITREQIADMVDQYLDGTVDNFALDDMLDAITTDDTACQEIAAELWYFYDDCSRHLNSGARKLSLKDEACIRRWVELLRSSSPWVWAKHHSRKGRPAAGWANRWLSYVRGVSAAHSFNSFWPWDDECDWLSWCDARKTSRGKGPE